MTILQVVELLIGVPALALATLVYESEGKQVQSKLAEWWIRIDDAHKAGISWHVATVQTFAQVSGQALDRVWGESVWSVRALAVSVCLSMASLLFADVRMAAGFYRDTHLTLPMSFQPVAETLFGLGFVLLVAARTLLDAKWVARGFPLAAAALLAAMISALHTTMFGDIGLALEVSKFHDPSGWVLWLREAGGIGFVLLGSSVVDFVFVAWTRAFLRWCAAGLAFWTALIVAVVNGSVPFLVLLYVRRHALRFFVARLNGYFGPQTTLLIVESNYVDMLAAWLFFGVAGSMWLHRLAWQSVLRPLHALEERMSLFKDRKAWLWGVGAICIGDLLTGGSSTIASLIRGLK